MKRIFIFILAALSVTNLALAHDCKPERRALSDKHIAEKRALQDKHKVARRALHDKQDEEKAAAKKQPADIKAERNLNDKHRAEKRKLAVRHHEAGGVHAQCPDVGAVGGHAGSGRPDHHVPGEIRDVDDRGPQVHRAEIGIDGDHVAADVGDGPFFRAGE